jgi:hypothetical protein
MYTDWILTMLSTELSGRDQWVIRESCYLPVKTMRPAPGAQSRPRANPERGGGEPSAPIVRSQEACLRSFFCLPFGSVFLRELVPWINRVNALRTQRSDAARCHIAVDRVA